jgi:hypothetical protein
MKSIIKGDSEDRCYICGRTEWIERHHIFNGTANRKKSEKLWNKIKDNGIDYKIGLRALGEEIDELLKEYE